MTIVQGVNRVKCKKIVSPPKLTPQVRMSISSPSGGASVRCASHGCAVPFAERKDGVDVQTIGEKVKVEQQVFERSHDIDEKMADVNPEFKKNGEYEEVILIELWAGVASMSQALEVEGISLSAFSEFDPSLLQRLKNRHRKALFTGDFNLMEWRSWKFNENSIVIVVGGPPCTALSSAGKRLMQWDPASDGIIQTLELAHFFGAHIVVLENVPELVTSDYMHGLLTAAIDFSENHGMHCVSTLILRDSEFGGFTQRVRAFVVFEKKDDQRFNALDAWDTDVAKLRTTVDVVPESIFDDDSITDCSSWLSGRIEMLNEPAQMGRASRIALIHLNEEVHDDLLKVGDLVSLHRSDKYCNSWRVLSSVDSQGHVKLIRSDHRHPNVRNVLRSQVLQVLSETCSVFDPRRCSVTLRRWGEPPINNGALILRPRSGAPAVRPLSPLEIWRLQRLPISNIQELRECGCSDTQIGAAAGNSIPFCLSQVIAKVIATRVHQMVNTRREASLSIPLPQPDVTVSEVSDVVRVLVIPIWMDQVPKVLVGVEEAFPIFEDIRIDGKLQEGALKTANRLARHHTGSDACTFLAAHLNSSEIVFALPLGGIPDAMSSFSAILCAQLYGSQYDVAMLAMNAVLSVAAPFPYGQQLPAELSLVVPEYWRQAQVDLLTNSAFSGRVAAQMLAATHSPSGALLHQMQAAIETSRAANSTLSLALHLHAKGCSDNIAAELIKWADAIVPVPWLDLPPQVYLEMDDFSNEELALVAIPQPCPALCTTWLQRAPAQRPVVGFNPTTIADLLLPDAVRRIRKWMMVQLKFLRDIERLGNKAVRSSNVPLALGQECFKEEARGVVWDLRKLKQGVITPLDFHAPIISHLNLDLFGCLLRDHPDQELLSFIMEGVRYKADLELQIVLLPHLISLRDGYSSLKSEVAKYEAQGWYGTFDHPPFLPYRAVPKGSVIRKLEPDRPRPTTEATAPRKLLLDTQGVQVISLNHASSGIPPEQCCEVFPTPLQCSSAEGWSAILERCTDFDSVSWVSGESALQMIERQAKWSAREAVQPAVSAQLIAPKWPKESKPRVSHVLIALAVLLHIAAIMAEPVFMMADDFKNFFNQLMLAPEDVWKCGLVLSDLIGPVFAAEYIMTFGLRPASNIAQRFADSILWIFRKRMVLCEQAFWEEEEALHPLLREWRTARKNIDSEIDQTQLFAILIYTDDPAMIVVGARRMARALQVWAELTAELGLMMAGANKRQCGTHIFWLGAGILANTGYAWVPKSKLLRCIAQLQLVLSGLCCIDEYHSLLGLLEHLLFMTSINRRMMLGLWHPFRRGFLPEPNVRVVPTPQMRVSIQRWITMLSTHAGASALRSVIRGQIMPTSTVFTIYGDAWASFSGAGLGGWCHGFFWEYQIPGGARGVPIAVLEFIAQWVSFFTFSEILPVPSEEHGSWSHWLHLRSDALSSPIILRSESPHSEVMEAVLAEAICHPQFDSWRKAMQVSHVFGVGNELADAASRQDLDRLYKLAQQLRVEPRRLQHHRVMGKLLRSARRTLSPVEKATAETVANTPTKASFMRLQVSDQQLANFGVRSAADRVMARSQVAQAQRAEALLEMNVPAAQPPPVVFQPTMISSPVRHSTVMKGTHQEQQRSNSIYSPTSGLLKQFRPRLRELQSHGYKVSTSNVEAGHWKYWTRFCESQKVGLWRDDHRANDGSDRAGYQEEIDILAAFLLFVLAAMPAKYPRSAPLPNSAANVVRGIRRIHSKQHPPITMVPFAAILPVVKGLNREYMVSHSYNMLLPVRKQPWRKSWLVIMCAVRRQRGTMLGSRVVDDGCFCTSFFAMWETLLQTGFRKSEVAVQHVLLFSPASHLTRASLSWCINKFLITDPTDEDLAQVAENDYAILNPPPSKTDQFGVIWGDKPIYLHVRHRNFMCAALRLLELERRFPLRGKARAALPLFTVDGITPFTYSVVTTVLDALKDIALPESVDHALYTTHSCRIYLCTALGAAGKSTAEIQALCRWQSPQSVLIYNRMQPADYARHLDDAAQSTITSYLMTGAPLISSRHLSARVSAAS